MLPPPGRLVDVGTHRLHLSCLGEGSPTVVLDSALGASSISWVLVQPALARLTRTCAYDRAGFGWSDAGPLPRTASRIANELYELLRRAQVPPPYVLVGHSFGGLVARLFAGRHPDAVAGMVLIEPAIAEHWASPPPEQQARIARGVRLCGYGTWAAQHGLARLVSALVRLGSLGAARALVSAISRGGFRREDEVILAPVWKLPADARRPLHHMWTERKFFDALGSQIASMCESALEVLREDSGSFGDVPLAVITGDGADTNRRAADEALARRSTRGRHIVVPESGHWVPLDAPQTVADAVAAIVQEVRGRIPLVHGS